MNKNTLIVVGLVAILVIAGVYWYSNNTAPAATSNEQMENESEMTDASQMPTESVAELETGTYQVDEERSTITWQAGKPAIAGYVHTGMFSLSDGGEFVLTDNSLSGSVTIDMNSLSILSLGGGKAGQESTLEGHLKGERFFNTEEYPTAEFTLTDISPKVLPGPEQTEYTATGELTMKGMTKEITFPITVTTSSETEAWMSAEFSINRVEWGIDFGSATIAEQITENIIGDEVDLELVIHLTK